MEMNTAKNVFYQKIKECEMKTKFDISDAMAISIFIVGLIITLAFWGSLIYLILNN